MSNLHERKYTRANALATALDERLQFEQDRSLAGDQPISADNWESQSLKLAELLGALAWAVLPEATHRPDPRLLDQLPSGLVSELRRRERAGQAIAARLHRASSDLRTGAGRLPAEDGPLMMEIARRAEGEASDALRRMSEL